MANEGAPESDGRARRGAARSATRVPVTVRTLRETTHGLVLDISPTGARLYMDGLVDCGNEVLLHWLGHDVFGVIAWSRQYECGIRFPRPLEPEVLAAVTAALAGALPSAEVERAPEAEDEPEPEPVARPAGRQTPVFASLSSRTIVRNRRRAF